MYSFTVSKGETIGLVGESAAVKQPGQGDPSTDKANRGPHYFEWIKPCGFV